MSSAHAHTAPVQAPAVAQAKPVAHAETLEPSTRYAHADACSPLSGAIPPSAIRSRAGLIQAKANHHGLSIGPVDDAYEREADAVAEQVVNTGWNTNQHRGPSIQRKCAACQEEETVQRKPIQITPLSMQAVQREADEEDELQRKPIQVTSLPTHAVQREGEEDEESEPIQAKALARGSRTQVEGSMHAGSGISSRIAASRGGGMPLQGATLEHMQQGFGRDFGSVRIHADGQAAQLSRDLHAKAFTVGNDVFFGAGQYQPQTMEGQHLLAHELTHTVQQRGHRMVQRVCDTVAYDARVAQVRALPLFSAIPAHPDALHTPADALAIANTLLTEARLRDNCMYYADALHLLFSTAEAPPSTISAAFGPIMANAARAERRRLRTRFGRRNRNVEERMRRSRARVWTIKTGSNGKTFRVDESDPANVVVHLKVRPQGNRQAVRQLRATEDAIEKRASVLGYTVDLEFVRRSGSDVFDVNVDPGAWPTSGNWVNGPETTAHELHHLLGLPDRYNYIDSHSGNDSMYIANRLHWFNEEFRRAPSPLVNISLMGNGNLVTDQDICDAMHATNMAACLASRLAVRQPGINARDLIARKVNRVIEILTGVSTNATEQANMRAAGATALGALWVEATVITELRRIAANMTTAEIQMENASGTECARRTITSINQPPALIICPTFNRLSDPRKAHQMVRAASDMIPGTLSSTDADHYGDFIARVYATVTI